MIQKIKKMTHRRKKMTNRKKELTHRRKIQHGKVEGGENIGRRTNWMMKMMMTRLFQRLVLPIRCTPTNQQRVAASKIFRNLHLYEEILNVEMWKGEKPRKRHGRKPSLTAPNPELPSLRGIE